MRPRRGIEWRLVKFSVMRFKYPNVIDVALAAGAPIYMTTFCGSERDFFFTAVTEVMVIFFLFDVSTFSAFSLVQVDN